MAETNEADVEVCKEASELRSQIQAVDRNMKELTEILDNVDQQDRPSAVSQMEELQKEQQLIKNDFGELLRAFFSVSSWSSLLSPENVLELLPKLKTEKEKMESLKIEMEEFKKEEDAINERLKILLSEFELSKSSTTDLEKSRRSTNPSSGGELSQDQLKDSTSGEADDHHSKGHESKDNTTSGGADDDFKKEKSSAIPTDGSNTDSSETNVEKKGESSNVSEKVDDLKGQDSVPGKTDSSEAANLEESQKSTDLNTSKISKDQSKDATSDKADDHHNQGHDDLKGNKSDPTKGTSTSKSGSSEINPEDPQKSTNPSTSGIGISQDQSKGHHHHHHHHQGHGDTSSSGKNFSTLLSKKLVIFRCYYLTDCWNEDYSLLLGVYSGLRVKTMGELDEKIIRLSFERRNEMAKARRDGKRTLMEWLATIEEKDSWENPLTLMSGLAKRIGVSLSLHLSNFMYIISENLKEYDKFRYLIYILTLLLENGKSMVIKKILYAIKDSEIHLSVYGKLKFHEITKRNFNEDDKENRDGNDGETVIDNLYDMFLKEVVCLESMLSYPIHSQQLRAMSDSLNKCNKRVQKIGLRMVYLNTLQEFIFENTKEEVKMVNYRHTMNILIQHRWDYPDKSEKF